MLFPLIASCLKISFSAGLISLPIVNLKSSKEILLSLLGLSIQLNTSFISRSYKENPQFLNKSSNSSYIINPLLCLFILTKAFYIVLYDIRIFSINFVFKVLLETNYFT